MSDSINTAGVQTGEELMHSNSCWNTFSRVIDLNSDFSTLERTNRHQQEERRHDKSALKLWAQMAPDFQASLEVTSATLQEVLKS